MKWYIKILHDKVIENVTCDYVFIIQFIRVEDVLCLTTEEC